MDGPIFSVGRRLVFLVVTAVDGAYLPPKTASFLAPWPLVYALTPGPGSFLSVLPEI